MPDSHNLSPLRGSVGSCPAQKGKVRLLLISPGGEHHGFNLPSARAKEEAAGTAQTKDYCPTFPRGGRQTLVSIPRRCRTAIGTAIFASHNNNINSQTMIHWTTWNICHLHYFSPEVINSFIHSCG